MITTDRLPKTASVLTKSHRGPVYCIKFNHTGEYCMTGSEDRGVCLYNPINNTLVKTYKAIHNYAIHCIDISKDDARFLTGGGDKVIILTDVTEDKSLRKYQGHTGCVNCLQYNYDYNVVVSGSYDMSVRCWDTRSNTHAPIDIIKGFNDSVTHLKVLRHQIITSCLDGYIRTFDIRKGETAADYFKEGIMKFAVSNDESMLAASCMNSVIYLMDRKTGAKLKEYEGHECRQFSVGLQFTPSDAHIVTGSEDGNLYVYDVLKSQYQLKLSPGVPESKSESKALSAIDVNEKSGIVTGGHDGNVQYWKM